LADAREPTLTIRPTEGRGKERATGDEDSEEGEPDVRDAEHQPAMDRFVRFIGTRTTAHAPPRTRNALTSARSMLDRHAEVIRGVGRENIEQLVGSLEFILESVATHPEWRFKGSPPIHHSIAAGRLAHRPHTQS
jgi:hypothetical protein